MFNPQRIAELEAENRVLREALRNVGNYAERQYGIIRYQIDEKDGDLTPWIHGDDWLCYPLLKVAQECQTAISAVPQSGEPHPNRKHTLGHYNDYHCNQCGLATGRWPSEPDCPGSKVPPTEEETQRNQVASQCAAIAAKEAESLEAGARDVNTSPEDRKRLTSKAFTARVIEQDIRWSFGLPNVATPQKEEPR